MEYYYTPKENVNIEKNELLIDGFEFKHLTRVLRKTVGDLIVVTDGLLNVYECKISMIENSRIICNIVDAKYNLYEQDINISLFISPLKNVSRFEFAIEKAIELGVKSIQPVITEHTVSKNLFSKLKMERFNKIIIGAMGQSQRCYLPLLNNTISFKEMLKSTKDRINKIVMYEFSDETGKFVLDSSSKDVALLIGPEGGFTGDEISNLSAHGWRVRSLGERKLRAETATIISLHDIFRNTLLTKEKYKPKSTIPKQ